MSEGTDFWFICGLMALQPINTLYMDVEEVNENTRCELKYVTPYLPDQCNHNLQNHSFRICQMAHVEMFNL